MDFAMKFCPHHSFNIFHSYQPVVQIWVFSDLGGTKSDRIFLLNEFILVKGVLSSSLNVYSGQEFFSVGTHLEQSSDQHCISFKGNFCNLLL